MGNFGDVDVKLTEESIAALDKFSASLNKFSEVAEKCVIVFREMQSTKQGMQQMGLWARLKC